MNKKYIVRLSHEEREFLQSLLKESKKSARVQMHARVLLKADIGKSGPGWTDEQIADAFDLSTKTVTRIRERFVEESMDAALYPRQSKRQYPPKITGEFEARLIALTCSDPPPGYGRWTLRLLADEFIALGHVESVSHETIRKTLKKMNLNLG